METPNQDMQEAQPQNTQPVVQPTKKNVFLNLRIIISIIIILVIFIFGLITLLPHANNKTLIENKTATEKSNSALSELEKKENINAVHSDLSLVYTYDPKDNEKLILKIVDFKTNTIKETAIPYLTEFDSKNLGRYKVSPDRKYILKITEKKFEIASLTSQPLEFKTIHEVSKLVGAQGTGGGANGNDFAHVGDVMWDDQGNLFFTTEVGLDGRSNPFGVYTELYKASEDGSSKKLVNDHTLEDENYGFMRKFDYIDTAKNEIYFGGETHASHNARMIVVNSETGKIVKTLDDLYTDISDPIFNKDFSKAYYLQDFKEEGYLYPVKIFEYDMALKTKRLLYLLAGATGVYPDTGPYIERSPASLYLDKEGKNLYFEVTDSKGQKFYSLDVKTNVPKVLFEESKNDKGYCTRKGISENTEYLFSICWDKSEKDTYKLTKTSNGKSSTFFIEKHGGKQPADDTAIKVLDFQ